MSDQQPKHSAGQSGKYACTRCGWKWTPRRNASDPPRACARCRSAYWQAPPVSARANSPDDPKWQAEHDIVARRKRERHMAKLRELAAEFNVKPPPIDDRGAVPAAKDVRQPAVSAVPPWVRFNEPPPERVPHPQESASGSTDSPPTVKPPLRKIWGE